MFGELKPKFAVSAPAVKCFKSKELCTEVSSRAEFGSRPGLLKNSRVKSVERACSVRCAV